MSDDWRLHVVLGDHGIARKLADSLGAGELEHALDDGYSERVIVSVDGHELFAYAGSREQVQGAADAISEVCRTRGWRADGLTLQHWHPVAEDWEDPDKPLPAGEGELEAERAELLDEERAESAEEGYPGWEVRVACESHHDTLALSERLDAEGLPHVRRWRYLLLGANDEQSAGELADRIRGELPASCAVTVEGSLPAIASQLPSNPFAVFGGLGG
jgi:hypothetical protein